MCYDVIHVPVILIQKTGSWLGYYCTDLEETVCVQHGAKDGL